MLYCEQTQLQPKEAGMASIPRCLNDDETTVVLAAFEPLYYRTFSFGGRGSFADFGKLPADIRDTINRAITEYQGAISEYRVYREEIPNQNPIHYVLGFGPSERFVALSPMLSPPTPHVIELATKATEPWSFWKETKGRGLKGLGGIGACLLIGTFGYAINSSVKALFFAAVGIIGFGYIYLLSPFLHYRRGVKVAKALLALEVLKSAPAPQSAEDIIRSRGGTFGPNKSEPKPA